MSPLCPADTVVFGDFCYYISVELTLFIDAEAACALRGGQLLYIESQEEQEFITQQLQTAFQNTQREWWYIGQ